MRTFFQDGLTTDAGLKVEVEYFYEDGACVVIKDVWQEIANGTTAEVVLTPAEDERISVWIAEHRFFDDHDESDHD